MEDKMYNYNIRSIYHNIINNKIDKFVRTVIKHGINNFSFDILNNLIVQQKC